MRFLVLAAVLAACSTSSGQDEAILGCWQRDGDGYSLVIEPRGRAAYELRYAAAHGPVNYDFPTVRWTRSGQLYLFHFGDTSQRRAHTDAARFENGELVIGGQPALYRASSETCSAWN